MPRNNTVTFVFSFGDINPANGKRVVESLFAELSPWLRVFVAEVLGTPAHAWNQVVESGALAHAAEGAEPMTYIVDAEVFEGVDDEPQR
jgi:hypothetical protein